jgi:MarR family transcriptional regulator for hemolysin
MSSTATAGKPARKGRGESSYAVYRVGGTTPEIRFTVQLVLAARRWRSLLDEHLRPIQQSSARMEAMSAILNSPPLSAQVDIAKRLRIEGPTLTRMLDTLEKDGLVERMPDPADRRTNKLRLTPAGERALEEIFEIVDVLRARLLDGMSPETIEQGNEILAGLMGKLDAGLPPPEGA